MRADLRLVDGKSKKFWTIETDGAKYTVRYGRIGTDGREQVKTFATAAEAEKAAEKLIAQKTKKGYSPVAAAAGKPSTGVAIEVADGVVRVSAGGPQIEFRHVELSREDEGEAHDRVSAELHVRLPEAVGGIPAERWVKALSLLTHDAYDGTGSLVLEDGEPFWTSLNAAARLLGIEVVDVVREVGAATAYPLGYEVLRDAEYIWDADADDDDDDVVLVEEPEPAAELPGSTDALLARAAELIETGIAGGEKLDPNDAYGAYKKSGRRDSPSFAEAQDILSSVDARDDNAGRSHATRGHWYERLEYQSYPRCAYETAKAWEKAVDANPDELEWTRRAAFAHMRSGKNAKALKLLNKLVKADKKNAFNYYLRGRCHLMIAKKDKALKELNKAIDLDDRDPRFFIARSECVAGDAAKADRQHAVELRKSVTIEPDADAHMLAGHAAELARGPADVHAMKKLRRWWDLLGNRVD